MHIIAYGATILMHTLFSVYTVRINPSHVLHVTCTIYLINFYCGLIIMLLAEVHARVCMCVRKLIIKVLSIFTAFPRNTITFFNLTVRQVC